MYTPRFSSSLHGGKGPSSAKTPNAFGFISLSPWSCLCGRGRQNSLTKGPLGHSGLVRGCLPNCSRHRPREHPSPVLIPKLGSRGHRSHLARALKWIRMLLGVCFVLFALFVVFVFFCAFSFFFFSSFCLLVFCNYKNFAKNKQRGWILIDKKLSPQATT